MAESSGWMVLVPQTRMGGEAINSGTPIPATFADKVAFEDAWIVGAYDNGYMKMAKIQVTSSNTYNLIASKYKKTFAAIELLEFSYDSFGGEDQLTPGYEVQLVAVKAQCPNQDWEFGTALCEEEYSDSEFLADNYYETSRFYCCERKISEECRPCSEYYYGKKNCTETCRKDIEMASEECHGSNNDKHEWFGSDTKDNIKREWKEGEKGARVCGLKYLVQESVCAKDGESCKENYCCDEFLCDGQVCRKDETPCWDFSSKVYKCKDVVARHPDYCKHNDATKALCPVTCGCKKCNIHGCAMD